MASQAPPTNPFQTNGRVAPGVGMAAAGEGRSYLGHVYMATTVLKMKSFLFVFLKNAAYTPQRCQNNLRLHGKQLKRIIMYARPVVGNII